MRSSGRRHILLPSMTSTSSTLVDRLATLAIVLCAVVLTGSVAYRTFREPPLRVTQVDTPPRFEKGWVEANDVGRRIGSTQAAITIVEFADVECPVCQHFQPTLSDLLVEYPTQVALVAVPFPLPYHKYAMEAARATECAYGAGDFRRWLDAVYALKDSLGRKPWGAVARTAGIVDTVALSRCARGATHDARIERGIAIGKKLGVPGTPTILVNGWMISGAPSKERLKGAIDALLRNENPFAAGKWAAR